MSINTIRAPDSCVMCKVREPLLSCLALDFAEVVCDILEVEVDPLPVEEDLLLPQEVEDCCLPEEKIFFQKAFSSSKHLVLGGTSFQKAPSSRRHLSPEGTCVLKGAFFQEAPSSRGHLFQEGTFFQ